MKKIYLTFITLTVCLCSNAQTTFHRYFAQSNSLGDLYRSVQTPDRGYAAIGHLTDLTTFDNDFLILKTDSNGNPLWIKKIATAESEDFTDIIVTTDSGLAVTGSSFNTTTFTSKAIVAKFDGSGNLMWSKSYTVSGVSSDAKKIQTDGAGNLYVLGSVDVAGSSDYVIMKLDPAGFILQQFTYGTPDADFPLAFLRNPNGDFFIGGWNNTGIGENIHILKINASMAISWNKLISSATKYFCYDMREKSNGNLVIAGRYDDGVTSYDMLLSEFDTTGSVIWAKYYSSVNGLPDYAYGLTINNATGSLAVTGVVEDTTAGTLIAETDATGNINWSERVGSTGMGEYGSGYGILTTTNGGYLVCGNRVDVNNSVVQLIKTNNTGGVACYGAMYSLTASAITLPSQSLTMTTNIGGITEQNVSYTPTSFNTLGNACQGVGINEPMFESSIFIYPNPFVDAITTTIQKQNVKQAIFILRNVLGQTVFSKQENNLSNTYTKTIDLSFLSKGIYLLDVNINGERTVKKIVKE